MTEFLEFTHGTPWYDLVWPLREALLREPLGLRLSDEDFKAERTQLHFALIDEGEPVACLIAKPLGDNRYQLRQMAVVAGRQGQGLGRRLVLEVEAVLRERGATELMLHARVSVTGFYEKLGYAKVGEEFVEVTIPHQEMVKRLE